MTINAPRLSSLLGMAGTFVMLLSGCSSLSSGAPIPPAAAFVVLGPEGDAWARVITTAASCPALDVDGSALIMQVRLAAGTMPQRSTASDPADSKASAFPVLTCELKIPPGAKSARIGAQALPLPKAEPRRIIVYGDSGCRMKKAENAWQACSDPDYWPFEKISDLAASMHPDLVIHVGDYHYRENACAPDFKGCQNSVWGYGWDAWDADFFQPATKLLAAAPWVVARGNHEECRRAGQGWYRFLDPRPYDEDRGCNYPSRDGIADYSAPYAVPLGVGKQLIVFDTAKAGNAALDPNNPKDAHAFQEYQKAFREVARLAARPGVSSLFLSHHPLLAFGPAHKADAVDGGSGSMLSVAKTLTPRYLPAGVDFAIHGHIHLLEMLNFSTDHPATMVAGVGGDNLEAPLPAKLPAGATPAEGAVLDTALYTDKFGFVVMDRIEDRGGADWAITSYDRNANPLAHCKLTGSKVKCDKTGSL